jgi:hypothetical protein
MANFELKLRHYEDVSGFVSHRSHDVSEQSMQKRAYAVTFLEQNFSKKSHNPKLVSSAEGKISKILFTIPKNIHNENGKPLWNIYQNIFKQLPEHTLIVLAVQQQALSFVHQWVLEHGIKERFFFIEIPAHINITVWAEDPFVVAEDTISGEKYFMEPHSFPRWEDGFIASFVSEKLNWNRTKLPIYFEGGNILVGDDFFLIGADYPIVSMGQTRKIIKPKDNESETDFICRIYNESLDATRKMIIVGSTLPVPSNKTSEIEINGEQWTETFFQNNEGGTVQPLFHIDMFVTLAGRKNGGKYRVLVGDPRLAAEILELDTIQYSMPELFDDVAKGLTNKGFEVIRLPLPMIYMDDPEKKKRRWYFASYNNCLVEIINEHYKTIWLPTYGYGAWEVLRKTDKYAKAIFEELGFNVIQLADYHPLAEDSGSLHCIKKYLDRI